ncbi:MAG: chorismate synthase [Bacteroidales bacterium]|jgi:chorismate synthase|nr:chorismate synthase [Bacteroidales bacterium]MDD3701594.1 chorismate synthase [Bacteroidales bacterium]MDY0370205.1 chorismate synthase [Bacteroidales bacterium]
MAANTFGEIYRLTSFGESHGVGIGGVIDGCPPGLDINFTFIQLELNRRRPGQSSITTARDEKDEVEFLSGLLNGVTTGTPLAFIVRNLDQKPKDYSHLQDTYRPSHADFTYEAKYGIRDHRGGGRASARETIARVVAGAIAKSYLKQHGISIQAYVSSIGEIEMPKAINIPSFEAIESSLVRCPHPGSSQAMIQLIEEVRKEGDTLGGIINCHITGLKAGLGAPVFDKFHADLAKAVMSINAVKGFEYGSGFDGVKLRGSSHNDKFAVKDGKTVTLTNHSGGIQGGITNGAEVYFRAAFKPVATLMSDQTTVDKFGKTVIIKGKGRHDVCVVPRAVVIVEAMAAIITMDHFLRQKVYQ